MKNNVKFIAEVSSNHTRDIIGVLGLRKSIESDDAVKLII